MKNFFLLTFFLGLTLFSLGQNWIKTNGTEQHEEILDATHDVNGNLILGGYHSSTFTLDGNTLSGSGVSQGLLIKTNPIGTTLWAKNIGNTGADRIYAITTDSDGNVYSTGYVSGSFDQNGIPVATNANSRDIFIAKHDANGTLIWIKTAGGTSGDTGYGIDIDSDGNVFVTGQFKGNGVFGPTNLQASFDDINNIDTYDFFVSKLDTDGDFLWTKKGNAKFNDRGMSVAVDQNNNVYIGGQFSDTLTFDNTHENSVINAGFLLKLDNDGNEIWFSKLAGIQSVLYDVKIDNNNNPIVTGDYIGNILIYGIGNQVASNSSYSNNVMVAKYNPNGQVQWLVDEGSENEVSSKQLTIDFHNNIYTSGTFRCRFDEFSEEHGTGIFYSMGYRDVFSTAYNSAGTRIWKEQYGGPKDDYSSAISASNTDETPTIAGSFERQFNFPTGDIPFINSEFDPQTQSFAYCGDNNYQRIAYRNVVGAKDLFYGKIRQSTNSITDYFYRNPAFNCVQDSLAPCISNCLDTIEFCDDGQLSLSSFTINRGGFGPILLTSWENEGFGINDSYFVDQSGTYTFLTSREDECWVNHADTIEVVIHDSPENPRMTDSWNININQPPPTQELEWCHPDTAIIHVDNFSVADTAYWSNSPDLIFINDSTIQVTETGEYEITFENGIGCTSYNSIEVKVDTFAIHDTLQPHIIFNDSVLQATDTIEICLGDGVGVFLMDSLFFPYTNGTTPCKTVYWSINSPATINDETETTHENNIGVSVTGDYVVNAHLENLCGDTVDYYLSRSLHIIVHANPVVSGSISGPGNVCPGDSVMIHYTSSADNYSISGPNIIENYVDSALILASFENTFYSISGSITDSVTSCYSEFYQSWGLTVRPAPQITIDPTHGIVCPNDSVELTALSGVAWEWVGPNDNSFSNNQTTHGLMPGFYHAIVTDVDGCVMTSNFVEAKEYSTPEIYAQPEVICVDGETEIKVLGSTFTTVNWLSPLSGNSFTQTVNAPGTYSCEMELCGITTIDSVTISESNPIGFISTLDDVMICPNDTVIFNANGGMTQYEWIDGSNQNSLFATEAGDYWCIVTDEYGCKDTSNILSISMLPAPDAPLLNDTSVCLEDDIILIASSDEEILWYNSPSGTQIHTGDSLELFNLSESTTIYIRVEDNLCSSEWTEAEVTIHQSSLLPAILGDTIICENSSLSIYTDSTQNFNYLWTLPNGTTSSDASVNIPNSSNLEAGEYSLVISDAFCSSDTNSVQVGMLEYPNPILSFSGDTTICFGEELELSVQTSNPNYLIEWNPSGANTNNLIADTDGSYFTTVSNGICSSNSDTITIDVLDEIQNTFVLDTLACPNSSADLSTTDLADVIWYNSEGDSVHFGSSITIDSITQTTVYSYAVIGQNSCESDWNEAHIYMTPTDTAPFIYTEGTACHGTELTLSTDNFEGLEYSWILPNDSLISTNQYYIPFMVDSLQGEYQLSVSINGCLSDTQSIVVEYHIADTIDLPEDTTICIGEIATISFSDSLNYNWSFGGDLSTLQIEEEGLVTVSVSNEFGCFYMDSIYVELVDCDSIVQPNVFTPNNDGINDVYYFPIIETQHQLIEVRNRWGNIIHRQESSGQISWDGRNLKTGEFVSPGTYFYMFQYTDWSGEEHIKEGFIDVLR